MAAASDPNSQAPSPGARLAAFFGLFNEVLLDLVEDLAATSLPADARKALGDLARTYDQAAAVIYESQLAKRSHRPGLTEALFEALAAVSAGEIESAQALAKWRAKWFEDWREDRARTAKRTPFARAAQE